VTEERTVVVEDNLPAAQILLNLDQLHIKARADLHQLDCPLGALDVAAPKVALGQLDLGVLRLLSIAFLANSSPQNVLANILGLAEVRNISLDQLLHGLAHSDRGHGDGIVAKLDHLLLAVVAEQGHPPGVREFHLVRQVNKMGQRVRGRDIV